jgi:hypothetical protein
VHSAHGTSYSLTKSIRQYVLWIADKNFPLFQAFDEGFARPLRPKRMIELEPAVIICFNFIIVVRSMIVYFYYGMFDNPTENITTNHKDEHL